MAENEEMTPIQHSREDIDKIIMLTALLVIRMETSIVGIITMKNRIILTITGVVQEGKRY